MDDLNTETPTEEKKPKSEDGLLGRFSAKRKTIPFEFEDENENVIRFVLREMNGTDRDAYLAALNRRMEVKGQNAIAMKSFDGIQSDLLIKCVFTADDMKPVKKELLQAWPASLLQKLHEKCQEMNGLKDAEDDLEDEAKNSS